MTNSTIPTFEQSPTPEDYTSPEMLEAAGQGALIAVDVIGGLAALAESAEEQPDGSAKNSLDAMSNEGIGMLQLRVNALANLLTAPGSDPENVDPSILKFFAGIGTASEAAEDNIAEALPDGVERDEFGFNEAGAHLNGTPYDGEGYDINGFDVNGEDAEGYDMNGENLDFDWRAHEDNPAAAQEEAEEARRYPEDETEQETDYR